MVNATTTKFLLTLGLTAILFACGKTQDLSALQWQVWHAKQPGQQIENLGAVSVEPSTADASPTLHKLAETQPGKPVFWELEAHAAIATPTGSRPQNQSLHLDVWWRCATSSTACTADMSPISLGREVVSLAASHSLRMNPNSDDSSNYTLVSVSGVSHVLLNGRARSNLASSITAAQFQQPRKLSGAEVSPSSNLEQLIANTPGELLVSIAAAKPGTPSAAWVAMQVRINAFGSEVAVEAPSQRLAVRAKLAQWSLTGAPRIAIATVVIVAALLAMMIWALRRGKNYPEGPPDDAPTRFGFLVCLWGCVLAAIPLAFAFMQGSVSGGWYYISLGLLYAWSGLAMRQGLSKGFASCVWALALAVVWSAIDFDFNQKQFWIQIGMPAIVSLSAFVMWKQGRLANESEA